jgi:Cu/Ag efflux protein CusF
MTKTIEPKTKDDQMNTKKLLNKTWIFLLTPAAALAFRVAADQMPASASLEKSVTGTVTSIDQQEKTISVKLFWGTKKFNIADDCKVSLDDKPQAALLDLRPGQELQVAYENVQGVKVAHQIAQHNVIFTGYVHEIDPANHTVTVRRHGLDKTFQIPDDCKIVPRDEKAGTLSDVQAGHRVTVTYEIPKGVATARQMTQTSATFSGSLTAIDLNERTLKAKTFLNAKKFNVADHCNIVISGKPEARLSDLKLGDKLVFSYDDVNGVNIVTRIATAGTPFEAPTTASKESHDYAMPMAPPY